MVTIKDYRKFVLSLNDVIELPHFEHASFRINKKIFTTLSEKEQLVMVKLSLADQDVFCTMGKAAVYPVPNAWGKQGATYIDLKNTNADLVFDAIRCAYEMANIKKK